MRTVVSTGAVPVTCVTPQADNQRVFAVSCAELPAQVGGGKLLADGETLVGAVTLPALLLEVLSEPQAASRRQRTLEASSAAGFLSGPYGNAFFNRELDKVNPRAVVVSGFYSKRGRLDAILECDEYVVKSC